MKSCVGIKKEGEWLITRLGGGGVHLREAAMVAAKRETQDACHRKVR